MTTTIHAPPQPGPETSPAHPLDHDPQVAAQHPAPAFPRLPGETPRAFSAFLAWFALGQTRSLPAVAGPLGERLDTVKRWSSRFAWQDRLQSFNAGLLQRQVSVHAARVERQAADWARRDAEHREQQWAAAQKLLVAVNCFLESFGDREVEKMTLGQVSRALQVSSCLARQALQGAPEGEQPSVAPLQAELAAALARVYGPTTPVSTPNGTQPVQPGRDRFQPVPVIASEP